MNSPNTHTAASFYAIRFTQPIHWMDVNKFLNRLINEGRRLEHTCHILVSWSFLTWMLSFIMSYFRLVTYFETNFDFHEVTLFLWNHSQTVVVEERSWYFPNKKSVIHSGISKFLSGLLELPSNSIWNRNLHQFSLNQLVFPHVENFYQNFF